MTDTLTTKEIREEFYEAYENNSLPLEFRSDFIYDKFDRWLEAHDAEVTAKAEVRIIELLDNFYPIRYPKSITTGGGEGELITEIIALIKGETE